MNTVIDDVSPPQKIEAVICVLPHFIQNLLGFCFQMGMHVERMAEMYPDAVIYSNGVAIISKDVRVQIGEQEYILEDIIKRKFTHILVLEPNTFKKGLLRKFVNDFITQLKKTERHHVVVKSCAV